MKLRRTTQSVSVF